VEFSDLVLARAVSAALVKSPLLWFLLVGAALFALDSMRQQRIDNTIYITQGDIQGIRDQWLVQSGKVITQDTLDALVDELVEERRLAREAVALGLDQDDVIVRRRLAQKLRFLTESLSDDVMPTETDLAEFFAAHGDNYREAGRWSFRHIYFSSESRGARAASDALDLLRELQQQLPKQSPAAEKWRAPGDPFMHGQAFENRPIPELEQLFGSPLVDGLAQADIERWHGTLASPFGYHLVWVRSYQPARAMELEQVRDQVLYDYRVLKRRLAYERYLANLAKKYPANVQVVMEP